MGTGKWQLTGHTLCLGQSEDIHLSYGKNVKDKYEMLLKYLMSVSKMYVGQGVVA